MLIVSLPAFFASFAFRCFAHFIAYFFVFRHCRFRLFRCHADARHDTLMP